MRFHLNSKPQLSNHNSKKVSLNPNQMKNYRPGSNLPFLSNILERSCPDAAHKSPDFQPSRTQISICLPCWSQHRNSSPLYFQWHSHSFWCQPSFWYQTTPFCCAILNNILVFLVWPSAGSRHTCQAGFSLFPQTAVTPSYPSLIVGCHKGQC